MYIWDPFAGALHDHTQEQPAYSKGEKNGQRISKIPLRISVGHEPAKFEDNTLRHAKFTKCRKITIIISLQRPLLRGDI